MICWLCQRPLSDDEAEDPERYRGEPVHEHHFDRGQISAQGAVVFSSMVAAILATGVFIWVTCP